MKKKKDTRRLLLDSAYRSFYRQGFQGSNINAILKDVGINKGSMYHFFKSKKELGLAVIKERIEENLIKKYEDVLSNDNTVKILFKILKEAPQMLEYGCPLNKLSQEMLYVDDDFRKSLSWVYEKFELTVEEIVQKGVDTMEINPCNTQATAQLIIATYEGALMIYHLNQNLDQYIVSLSRLEGKIVNLIG
jgi:TetR/AcrR family transcriptional repressor of nem operon